MIEEVIQVGMVEKPPKSSRLSLGDRPHLSADGADAILAIAPTDLWAVFDCGIADPIEANQFWTQLRLRGKKNGCAVKNRGSLCYVKRVEDKENDN